MSKTEEQWGWTSCSAICSLPWHIAETWWFIEQKGFACTPVWPTRSHMWVVWSLQANDSELDCATLWCQVLLGECKIHWCQWLCPRVQSQVSTRKQPKNTYRSYTNLLTGISRASLSRMASCLSMYPSSYCYFDGMLVCLNNSTFNLQRTNFWWFWTCLNYTRLMCLNTSVWLASSWLVIRWNTQMREVWATVIYTITLFGNCMRLLKVGMRERLCLQPQLAKIRQRLIMLLGTMGLWWLSQCCGMTSCQVLCVYAWGALPQSWAPVTNAGRPKK